MKAKVWESSYWIEDGKPDKREYDTILYECGFEVLRYVAHCFEPEGYTGLWLLAESHLALHTWPEENKHYVQLSSCNEEKHKLFDEIMKDRVKE